MPEVTIVASVLPTAADAEHAVNGLRAAGIDADVVSVVGRGWGTEEQLTGYFTSDGTPQYCGRSARFWQQLWSAQRCGAFLLVPGTGPVTAAGPIAARLAGPNGAGSLWAALRAAGIPAADAARYEAAVRADQYLVVVRSAGTEVEAQRLLRAVRSLEVGLFRSTDE